MGLSSRLEDPWGSVSKGRSKQARLCTDAKHMGSEEEWAVALGRFN